MRCCISRNRNIGIESLAIICADFDSISTRFQINRVCYFLTIHFNGYIRQFSRCYDKRNRIFRCRQKGRSIRINAIIAAGSSDIIKEPFRFHIIKGLCFSGIRVLKASRDIFSSHEIIVFKSRCIRRNTACNTTQTLIRCSGSILRYIHSTSEITVFDFCICTNYPCNAAEIRISLAKRNHFPGGITIDNL